MKRKRKRRIKSGRERSGGRGIQGWRGERPGKGGRDMERWRE